MTMAARLGLIACADAAEQPVKRFPDDVERGQEQQARLDERGKALHFPVAVEMLRVGGLVRDAHGKIGDDGGDEIEDRMQGLRKNSQAAGDAARNTFRETSTTAEPTEPSAAIRFSRVACLMARSHAGDYTLRGGEDSG